MIKRMRVKQAIKDFRASKQTARDYIDMFIAVGSCTTQGNGLFWVQVLDAVDEELEEAEGIWPTT
jgi:hypothetical protein